MNIEKSNWSSNGDNIVLSVPFTKVNREKRTVSGFATLDNVDQTGDVVTADASMKAFENFRGNLREMHQPIAVGKVVSFKPETFYDPEKKEFFNGVYVDAYISKGSQDTWEKVLDGTLQGFSIGGKIKESENEVNKSTGQSVRFIKDYDLMELSIVDSPANELCNILSISKVNGQPAELIGWVESSDVNKSKEIDKILVSFKKSRLPLPAIQTIAKQANADGGNNVSDNTENVVAEDAVAPEAIVEAPAVAEDAAVEAVETVEAETLEKAADVSEVEVDEPDFAKMLGDLKGFFSETLNKASEANSAQVSAIKETVETFSKSVDGRISELAEQHKALINAVTEIRGTIDGVQKRVDAVENDTAIKKSSDLGGSKEATIKKSKWNGSFLGSVQEIFN